WSRGLGDVYKRQGAMRDAQSIFDQIVAYSNKKVFYKEVAGILSAINQDIYFKFSDAVKQKNLIEGINVAHEVYYSGWDIITFINGLTEHFRNILTYLISKDVSLIEASENIKEKYKNISNDFSTQDILRIITLLTKSINEFKQTSNQKLTLEILLSQIIELPSSAQIDKLIQEIRTLKSHLTKSELSLNSQPIQQVKPRLSSTMSESKDHSQISAEPTLELSNPLKSLPQQDVKIVSENLKIKYDKSNSLDDIQKKWETFIQLVKTEKRIIGDSLEHTRFDSIDGNKINLICNKEEEASIIESFRDYLFQKTSQHFGSPYKIAVTSKPITNIHSNVQDKTTVENDIIYNFIKNELKGEKISE
ncbi:MAG: hypothetical protein N3A61_01640, partial [Ignavibacteria bacterium]|nr:hypothetical protein [Ignavibacteria bacterium]